MRFFNIKYLRTLLVLIFSFSLFSASTNTAAANESNVDVKEIVLGHMSDAYEWHITTWNGRHISIPLPVIVKSQNGDWHVFSSARFEENPNHSYKGFYLNEEQNGKIYEHVANGEDVRPLDLSITKDVVQLWIVVIVMASIFIGAARWYKGRKPSDEAPKGFVGLVEMFVMSIVDDLIRPCSLPTHRILLHFHYELTRIDSYLPWRCQHYRQYQHHICLGHHDHALGQLIRQQRILERNPLASRSHMAQMPCTNDAYYRSVWNLYQAVRSDGSFIC